jgi:hypothetical protein
MKHLRSTPNDHAFFSVYAKLAKSVKASGYFAQVVSALTEVGGIFAASLSILSPIFGQYAVYPSAAVAIIGTAVLEVGLRVTAPQCVDAVLYKRWQGLHMAMSIAVFVLGFVLLGTSGVLSYKNSRTVVDSVVTTPQRDSSAIQAAQIVYNANKAKLGEAYRADSTTTAQQYEKRIQATTAAFSGKLGAAQRELSNVYNKEKRTGQSYATAKDQARQKIADVEAEQAAELAQITTEQAAALAALKAELKAGIAKADSAHGEALAALESEYSTAQTERKAIVNGYGGGLAYFTVICLFIFLASVILDRIHAKGSGIDETVELSQYDINPPAYVEAWQAMRERVQTTIRAKIAAFEERTPAAPLPTSKRELYDPTELANVRIKLELDDENEGEERTIRIAAKRRPIGFFTQGANARQRTADKGAEGSTESGSTNATVNGLTKQCDNCGGQYQAKVKWQRFCSTDCKTQWHAAQHNGVPYSPNMKKRK